MYIDKNIPEINRMGVGIEVEKITKDEFDEEIVEIFRKKGISRLPVMFAPDGMLFIGVDKIQGLFEKNLNGQRYDDRVGPVDDETDLAAYWEKQMMTTDKKGKRVGRTDPDDCDDPGKDIEKKMAQYNRNRPKHHRDDEERNPTRRERRRRDEYSSDEDNLASSDEEEDLRRDLNNNRRQTTRKPVSNMSENDMDDEMLAAYMDKI
jgi:hypothetical protein